MEQSQYLYQNLGLSEKRKLTIDRCKSYLIAVKCHSHGSHTFAIANSCMWKYCPKCQELRLQMKRRVVFNVISEFKEVRMLGLSFKNIDWLTKNDLKVYEKQFKMIMRYLKRKGLVDNYIKVTEITNKGKGWHFHFHVIYDGKFISELLLSELLRKATHGESYIADAKRIYDGRQSPVGLACWYISKYLGKLPVLSNKDSLTYARVFSGKRMFDSSKRIRKVENHGHCRKCGSVLQIFNIEDDFELSQFIDDWFYHYFKATT